MTLIKESIEPYIQKGKCRIVYYGTYPKADAYADGIHINTNEETEFTFHCEGRQESFALKIQGLHNVNNALAAILVGRHFDVSLNSIREALYQYEPLDMRGKIIEANGITVIDDTYNASTESMVSGLQVLYQIKNVKRRIAVLADILELGSITKHQHEHIGYEILKNEEEGKTIDELITVGEAARYIADVVRGSSSKIKVASFENNTKAAAYLKRNIRNEDVYFVKGSRGMHMEEICTQILS
jgi:UDP-N-acetylmuramoyl-tripeptide--D-alanyl-D-alanine ligase